MTSAHSDAREWSAICFIDEVGYLFIDWNLIRLWISQHNLELSWNVNILSDELDFYFTYGPDGNINKSSFSQLERN